MRAPLRFSIRQSEDVFDGKQIVLFSRSLETEQKEPAHGRSKTVTQPEDGGRKIVHRQYSLGAAAEERLVMELVLTRKSAGANSGR